MRIGLQLLICAVLAVVPALAVGAIAFDHNPQGEFANMETGSYTEDLYELVGITWAIFAIPMMGLVALIAIVRRPRH